MVGVAGSNPVVSTKFIEYALTRDAEECRELAPAQDLPLPGASAYRASP